MNNKFIERRMQRMILSKKKALNHFKERALPRRTHDIPAEKKYYEETGRKKAIYRKITSDELNRGELYPILHNGTETFAHFGIGIGIYFTQLLTLALTAFICGMIMITGAAAYQKPGFGDPNKYIPFAAVCLVENVTATVGCPLGQSECIISHRPNCELPESAVIADLIMCGIFVIAIFVSKLLEQKIEEKLDETVQTAQDYSVEVLDPDVDADDPDEWYEYFSQFGDVKYITIVKRNMELMELILKKHKYTRKLQESGKAGSHLAAKRDVILKKYDEINTLLTQAMQKDYPVCRIFVTFESEEHQRQCLTELEVPDIQAFLDMHNSPSKKNKNNSNQLNAIIPQIELPPMPTIEHIQPSAYLFRRDNVLNVKEPTEPDNIIWKNIETDRKLNSLYSCSSLAISFGLFVVCWFLVVYTSKVSSNLLAVVIGFVDSCLPMIFRWLTDMTSPSNEGSLQSRVQMRLFFARFLLSTIIPYVQSNWNEVLNTEFIQQIFIVQIFACFTAPLLAFTDIFGLFDRHIYSPYFSDTQEEMNSHWTGSEWSLAEKYTGIAKVLCVSLFYSLISPVSILLSMVAFICIFCIDNYLLLRRWKQSCMIDSKIATRLRQQAVLAVAAHMYVTVRFIYSWPMDEAYWDGTTFEKVNKYPNYKVWHKSVQDWHSDSQKHILVPYIICFILVAITSLYMLIVEPLGQSLYRWFCYDYKTVGETQGVPFSSLTNIMIYYPILSNNDQRFLCSYAKNVLPKHRPVLVEVGSVEKDDLSSYVPLEYQTKVLSIVKYFGDGSIESSLNDVNEDDHNVFDVPKSSQYSLIYRTLLNSQGWLFHGTHKLRQMLNRALSGIDNSEDLEPLHPLHHHQPRSSPKGNKENVLSNSNKQNNYVRFQSLEEQPQSQPQPSTPQIVRFHLQETNNHQDVIEDGKAGQHDVEMPLLVSPSKEITFATQQPLPANHILTLDHKPSTPPRNQSLAHQPLKTKPLSWRAYKDDDEKVRSVFRFPDMTRIIPLETLSNNMNGGDIPSPSKETISSKISIKPNATVTNVPAVSQTMTNDEIDNLFDEIIHDEV